ncbi:MAG: alpha/beta hydrolase [Hyphomicrobiaceae bacterium]|nr:alpha/beta hydrolase [Hyphomicrobiaceae bacterium]
MSTNTGNKTVGRGIIVRTRNFDLGDARIKGFDPQLGDRVLRLTDGRRLCYRVCGAPDGMPIIALHGTPGSRLKFSLAGASAAQRGLRLISPDRWSYGGSDAPDRAAGLGDYAADIAALADELQIDRISLVGLSGGGPYAVAAAALLGRRVDRLALIAPVSPLASPGDLAGVGLFHRFCFRGLPLLPGGSTLAFTVLRLALALSPDAAVKLVSARAGRPDRQVLATREVRRSLAETFSAGLASGVDGARIDMRLFARRWGVDPATITAHSCLWIGTRDRNVPQAAALRLAAQIPTCTLEQPEGAGHFWVLTAFEDVLDWLAGKR